MERARAGSRSGVGALCLAFAVSATSFGPALAADDALVTGNRVIWGYEEGVCFNLPRGLAFDVARDEIVVANTAANRVEIYSAVGRPLVRFRHDVRREDGAVVDGLPRAVAIDARGNYLIADNRVPYVDRVDRRGRSVGRIEIPATPPGTPMAIHVARDGALWIGGPVRDNRIYRFSTSGEPLGTWGVSGTAAGQLQQISGIATLPDGNVVVACAGTELGIQIFTPDGVYVRGFGLHDVGPGNVSFPSGVVTTDDGRIWLSDELRQTVQVYNSEGTYLGMFGGMGQAAGDFLYPSAIATDGRRRIVVAEREGGRVQVFMTKEGGDAPRLEAASAGN